MKYGRAGFGQRAARGHTVPLQIRVLGLEAANSPCSLHFRLFAPVFQRATILGDIHYKKTILHPLLESLRRTTLMDTVTCVEPSRMAGPKVLPPR